MVVIDDKKGDAPRKIFFSLHNRIRVLHTVVPSSLMRGEMQCYHTSCVSTVVVELILGETTGVMCWPIGSAHEAIRAQPPHVFWCLVTSADTSQVPQVSGRIMVFFFPSFFPSGELRLKNRSDHRPPRQYCRSAEEGLVTDRTRRRRGINEKGEEK